MKTINDFDVALTFAGEDRVYVDRVANLLRAEGVKVFYDMFEQADLWGQDLYVYLSELYQRRARFTVMFISKHYAEKQWANHERKAAQARAFQEAQEYILPARFDNTAIPGILPTIGYISLVDLKPEDFVSLVKRKLVSAGGSVPTELVRINYSTISHSLPNNPTELTVLVKDDEGRGIASCTVTAQANNGTTIQSTTNEDGNTKIVVATRRAYTLLVANALFPAVVIELVDPAQQVHVELPRTENVGSVLIETTGYIPGFAGRLSPIFDTFGRRYLYANNIAINGGKQQPVNFEINDPIELEDANGLIIYATIKYIAAQISLIQYSRS